MSDRGTLPTRSVIAIAAAQVRVIEAVELDLGDFGVQHARVEATDCWTWLGFIDPNGYGRVGRNSMAHRVVYRVLAQSIPAGLVLDHLCRHRACVNPAHLDPVTVAENNRRAVRGQTHCSSGHPYNLLNTRTVDGRRYCRICQRAAQRRSRARKVAA